VCQLLQRVCDVLGSEHWVQPHLSTLTNCLSRSVNMIENFNIVFQWLQDQLSHELTSSGFSVEILLRLDFLTPPTKIWKSQMIPGISSGQGINLRYLGYIFKTVLFRCSVSTSCRYQLTENPFKIRYGRSVTKQKG
jgi:hypothetical protein